MRVQDLFISGHNGFMADHQLFQRLEGMQDIQFESVGEKEWGELSVSYTIEPEDAGKELKLLARLPDPRHFRLEVHLDRIDFNGCRPRLLINPP